MAVTPAGDKYATGRRPSFRGILMQDMSAGKPRARKWPRKRNKAKTKEEQRLRDKFRAAQFAAKFMSPTALADIYNAVEGTPLLPRDMVTVQLYQRMAYFVLPDGKARYPMTSRRQVSQLLDTITQTPGQTIVRGDELWEAVSEVAEFLQLPDYAWATRTGTTSSAANSWNRVPFNTLRADRGITLDGATGRFTTPRAGLYQIAAQVTTNGVSAAQMAIELNGALHHRFLNQPANQDTLAGSTMVYQPTDGGTIAVSTYNSNVRNWLTGQWHMNASIIGPL